MKKVALYARQSIEKEGSLSLEAQLERCRAKLLPNEEYIEFRDAGFSGKDMNRPQFQKMMDMVTTHQISKIIVWKLDRYSRSIISFWDNYKILEQYDVEFVSVEEEYISNKGQMGKLMTSILVSFAEMERDNIKLRVKTSYIQRTKERGSWPGGPAPIGFTIGKIPGTKIPTLVPIPEVMECVKNAFEMYAKGNISLGELGRYFANNGIYGKNGKTYDNSAMSRMLHNPIYVKATQELYNYFKVNGVTFSNSIEEWNGTTSCHLINKRPNESEPDKEQDNKSEKKYRQRKPLNKCSVYLTNVQGVVEAEDYIRCQYNLSQNKQIKNTGKGKLGFLGGILKCEECGRAIKCYHYPYVRCWGKVVGKNCDNEIPKWVTIPSIQSYVSDIIQDELNVWRNYTSQCQEEVQEYQRQIDTLEKEIDNLLDFVAAGAIGFTRAQSRIEERNKQIEELKVLIGNIQGTSSISEDIVFEQLEESEKFKVVQTLIESITISSDGRISITPKTNNGRHIVNMDKFKKAQEQELHSDILGQELEEVLNEPMDYNYIEINTNDPT